MSSRARILRAVLCLASAAAFGSCKPRSQAPVDVPGAHATVALPGCYALYMGNGRPVVGSVYNTSPMVRLDTAVLPRYTNYERRLMTRLDTAGRPLDPDRGPSPFSPAWWYSAATDTVVVSFVDGFSGASLSLYAPPGPRDTLRGTISEHWDSGPPYTRSLGGAYAVRVPCRDTVG